MQYHMETFHRNKLVNRTVKIPANRGKGHHALSQSHAGADEDIRDSFGKCTPFKNNDPKKVKLDRLCLEMIVKDMRPLSTTEMPGFAAFVSALNPRYKPPSRSTLASRLPALYTEVMANLMKDAESWNFVSLTTDLWTSCLTTAFISTTAHFLKVISFLIKEC